MKVRELLYNVTKKLDECKIENASYEAKEITASCLEIKVSDLLFLQNDNCPDSAKKKTTEYVQRRANGEPLQYILGEWTFCSLPFKVGKGVLIPRIETEFIVYQANSFLKGKKDRIIFDLCSGSGCIGISVAVNNPGCEVYLLDISPDALSYAEKNVLLNGVKNVTIFKYDISDGYKSEILPAPDIILSNPPYIRSDEIASLQPEVLREPVLALDGGDDGLDFYKILAEKWLGYIKDGGMFVLESGENQPPKIKNMIDGFSNVKIEQDFFSVERFVTGYK